MSGSARASHACSGTACSDSGPPPSMRASSSVFSICDSSRCESSSSRRASSARCSPSAIASACSRMLVSGVRSSCVTEAKNACIARARRCSRQYSHASSSEIASSSARNVLDSPTSISRVRDHCPAPTSCPLPSASSVRDMPRLALDHGRPPHHQHQLQREPHQRRARDQRRAPHRRDAQAALSGTATHRPSHWRHCAGCGNTVRFCTPARRRCS